MNFIRSLIYTICFIVLAFTLGPLIVLARPLPLYKRYKFAVQGQGKHPDRSSGNLLNQASVCL